MSIKGRETKEKFESLSLKQRFESLRSVVELSTLAVTPPGIICEWVKVAQLCLTLCDHMNCSPPVSSVHGILQTRILEWEYEGITRIRQFPSPSPGDLPDPGIELSSLMSPALAGQFFTTSVTCNSIYPSLVMCTSRLEQLWEFLNYCNLESQLGKSPRPCIHPVGETSHCSFGDSCL